MEDWLRTALISGGSSGLVLVANHFLSLWRDDRKARRELEEKRQARIIEVLRELTEPLARGLALLSDLEYEDLLPSRSIDDEEKGVVYRLKVVLANLEHAEGMGLPAEVNDPIHEASGGIFHLLHEGHGAEGDAREAMEKARDAVAKYLREN